MFSYKKSWGPSIPFVTSLSFLSFPALKILGWFSINWRMNLYLWTMHFFFPKIPFCQCTSLFCNTEGHLYSSLFFCFCFCFLLLQEPPETYQGISRLFQTSTEKVVYTINSFEGPLPYKFWMNTTKGHVSLQGKMGEAPLPLLEACIELEAPD